MVWRSDAFFRMGPGEWYFISIDESDLAIEPHEVMRLVLLLPQSTSASSGSTSSCSSSKLIAMVTKSLSVMMPTNSP